MDSSPAVFLNASCSSGVTHEVMTFVRGLALLGRPVRGDIMRMSIATQETGWNGLTALTLPTRLSRMTTTYRLTAISTGSGTCDHCGRRLRKLCTITNGADVMTVGQACCKELTGWTPDAARLRQQQREDAAADRYADLWARATAARATSMGRFARDLMLEGAEWTYWRDEKHTVAQIVALAEAEAA